MTDRLGKDEASECARANRSAGGSRNDSQAAVPDDDTPQSDATYLVRTYGARSTGKQPTSDPTQTPNPSDPASRLANVHVDPFGTAGLLLAVAAIVVAGLTDVGGWARYTTGVLLAAACALVYKSAAWPPRRRAACIGVSTLLFCTALAISDPGVNDKEASSARQAPGGIAKAPKTSADSDTPAEQDPQIPYDGGWGPQRATYTIRNPSPTAQINSIRNNPAHGDERNFVQCKPVASPSSAYADSVVVEHPTLLTVYFIIENSSTVAGQDLKGFRTELVLPDPQAGRTAIGVVLSADNAEAVWDGCRIYSREGVDLRLIPGSAELHTRDAVRAVPDEIVAAKRQFINVGAGRGVIPASTQSLGYTQLQVLATPLPAPAG